MELRRIFDILELYNNDYKGIEDALSYKNLGNWIHFSAEDYYNYSHYFACGLLAMGFKKGDKIATISQNQPHWNILDMGMSMAGVVHVPIYPTLGAGQTEYILRHSDSKMLIISDRMIYRKIHPVVANVNSIQNIYTLNDIPDIKNWVEIIQKGRTGYDSLIEKLQEVKNSISPDDLFTIIYTSGTTGDPKGVMLSHKNLLSNAKATSELLPVYQGEKVLSFLPLCHVYERMMSYNYQILGLSIYYAESMGKIVDNLQEVKPQGFNAVPRLLEKFYDRIMAKGKDLPKLQKSLFFWAVSLGTKYNAHDKNNLWYRLRLWIARGLIFKKWQAAFGGELRVIVSGGSSLQSRLAKLFWAADLPVIEGYGMSETSPVIAVNHFKGEKCRIGTVGTVLKATEMKIGKDGEILARGPHVMMGYYKDEKATQEVIDQDGWMHTGDVGQVTKDKFLIITDRKKEIFKTSSGKYIAPQVIENMFKASSLIEQIMIVGENEKFVSALISPNFNYLHYWASKHKIHYRDNNELIRFKEVIQRFQEEINKVNKSLGDHERIKRFRLVCDEWSPQTGELSPTLKLRRKVLYQKYDSILQEIYGHSGDKTEKTLSDASKSSHEGNKLTSGLGKLIPLRRAVDKQNSEVSENHKSKKEKRRERKASKKRRFLL